MATETTPIRLNAPAPTALFANPVSAPLVDVVLTLRPGTEVAAVDADPAGRLAGMFDELVGNDLLRVLSAQDGRSLRHALLAGGEGRTFPLTLPQVRGGPARRLEIAMRHENGGEVRLFGRDLHPLTDARAHLARALAALHVAETEFRSSEIKRLAVLAHTAEAVVVVDARTGRILDLSEPAACLLGVDPEISPGTAFTQCFAARRRGEFLDALHDGARSPGRPVVARLGGVDGGAEGATVHLWPALARNGEERFLICRMTRPDGTGQSPDEARLAALASATQDGLVCLDGDGLIAQVNDGFLAMVGADAAADLLGRPFGGFLRRGASDMRLLSGPDRPRCFATQLVGLLRRRLAVEVAASDLPGGGVGLVLRDMTLAGVTRAGSDDAVRLDAAMLARVGTVPLRDIVAETAEATERQCIAQAIALTGNNRVAAADMLGLSRQSLYVKLRRFGLSERGDD